MDTNTIVQAVPALVTAQSILINVLLGVATAIGTTLIPFLISFLRKKLAQSQSELTMTVYDEVSQVVLDVVKEAQGTLVATAKVAANDGKITTEEAAKIKKEVMDRSLELLSNKTINLIGKEGQNVNQLISTIIESKLADVKDNEVIIKSTVNK